MNDELQLSSADITHAHLYHFWDVRFRDHIVKNRCVRIREAFIRLAEIGVRIEMQNTHVRISLRVRSNCAERHRMIATEDHGDFAGIEECARFVTNPLIDGLADLVDGANIFAA